ncbi:septum formation protein Maf [Fusibacter sp. A1]|nr:Maf family protein [Fusibacter sp. A1]MCK8060666.1 Maf family protein [Fusibacter sp. A2]NPE22880.1 septum formation protein Maf [Fusibacter sp. A1]RXV60081.1 septum formation protein Maf [Fusibacter sp. A1]
MMRLVLASKSPRRKELLGLIASDFIVKSAETPEIILPTDEPHIAVMALAFEKAKVVQETCEKDSLVIGADTIVYCGEYMGKPKDKEDARRMLKLLSGNVHRVLTGFCVYQAGTNRKIVDYSETTVRMKVLSDAEIDGYIESGEPMDKAGAYGIQGKGALFIKHIEGDFHSVMGLPVNKLYETLNRHFK